MASSKRHLVVKLMLVRHREGKDPPDTWSLVYLIIGILWISLSSLITPTFNPRESGPTSTHSTSIFSLSSIFFLAYIPIIRPAFFSVTILSNPTCHSAFSLTHVQGFTVPAAITFHQLSINQRCKKDVRACALYTLLAATPPSLDLDICTDNEWFEFFISLFFASRSHPTTINIFFHRFFFSFPILFLNIFFLQIGFFSFRLLLSLLTSTISKTPVVIVFVPFGCSKKFLVSLWSFPFQSLISSLKPSTDALPRLDLSPSSIIFFSWSLFSSFTKYLLFFRPSIFSSMHIFPASFLPFFLSLERVMAPSPI